MKASGCTAQSSVNPSSEIAWDNNDNKSTFLALCLSLFLVPVRATSQSFSLSLQITYDGLVFSPFRHRVSLFINVLTTVRIPMSMSPTPPILFFFSPVTLSSSLTWQVGEREDCRRRRGGGKQQETPGAAVGSVGKRRRKGKEREGQTRNARKEEIGEGGREGIRQITIGKNVKARLGGSFLGGYFRAFAPSVQPSHVVIAGGISFNSKGILRYPLGCISKERDGIFFLQTCVLLRVR